MVRKIYKIFDKMVALTGLECYKHGNRIYAATLNKRGHHVSKDFKVDKKWKVL